MDITFLYLFLTAALIFFLTIFAFTRRYKRCPSDMIMVIYGKVGAGQSAICIHGGAKFIMPVIQDYAFLSLIPMTISIPLKNALSRRASIFTHGSAARTSSTQRTTNSAAPLESCTLPLRCR